VTRSAQHQNDVAEHLADNGQLSFSPDVVLKRTLHKAGKNESVSTVAARYRVSRESIADWNRVSALAAFKVGQQVVLFLPAQNRVVASKASPNRKNAKVQPTRAKSPSGKPVRAAPKKR
jgi:membrane-bound lytic murein transglycosylase D